MLAGDWIALGCASLGQLLVWEWRSENYVLKQQGHYFDVSAAAFSPDGALVATGADDCKVKLFQMSSGFCFVTFSDHTAPVTQVRENFTNQQLHCLAGLGLVIVECGVGGSIRVAASGACLDDATKKTFVLPS